MLTVQLVAPCNRLESPLCLRRRQLASNEHWLQTSIDQPERLYARCSNASDAHHKDELRNPAEVHDTVAPHQRRLTPPAGLHAAPQTQLVPSPLQRRPPCHSASPRVGFLRPSSCAAGSHQTPGNSSSLCVWTRRLCPARMRVQYFHAGFLHRLSARAFCRSRLQRFRCTDSRAEVPVHGRRPGRFAAEACPP